MSELVIFDGDTQPVEVRLEGETVWLSLQQLADLFGRDKSVISRHLKNIFDSKELDRDRTVAKHATVQKEGRREVARDIEFFNLDAIISVGYRVNSARATHFRQWATCVLREHLTKGYSLNEHRLAQQGMAELEQAMALLSRTLESQELVTDIGREAERCRGQFRRARSHSRHLFVFLKGQGCDGLTCVPGINVGPEQAD